MAARLEDERGSMAVAFNEAKPMKEVLDEQEEHR